MSRVRYMWFVLLSSLAAAIMPVSARAYYGYGHSQPYYGYSYGPEFNYGYFTSPIFGYGSDDKVHPYRNLDCPILCLDSYWRDIPKRRPIVIIRGNRILIH
jgi:hypothetical protein